MLILVYSFLWFLQHISNANGTRTFFPLSLAPFNSDFAFPTQASNVFDRLLGWILAPKFCST